MISLVNIYKSTENYRFVHIYEKKIETVIWGWAFIEKILFYWAHNLNLTS